jgi:hypothetical protein
LVAFAFVVSLASLAAGAIASPVTSSAVASLLIIVESSIERAATDVFRLPSEFDFGAAARLRRTNA